MGCPHRKLRTAHFALLTLSRLLGSTKLATKLATTGFSNETTHYTLITRLVGTTAPHPASQLTTRNFSFWKTTHYALRTTHSLQRGMGCPHRKLLTAHYALRTTHSLLTLLKTAPHLASQLTTRNSQLPHNTASGKSCNLV